MKRLPLVVGLALAAGGCSAPVEPTMPPTTRMAEVETVAPVVVPPEPVPAKDGTCPYVKTAFVAETNGQRVGRVRLSADQPHPACFFYRSDGGEQLRIQVLVGLQPATAKAVIDRAAPVDSSDPATLPGGWEGGKQPTDSGAVFAVAKAGAVVVVVTNQKQTIKASRIAEEAVSTLGL